jgi:hypothetical protein
MANISQCVCGAFSERFQVGFKDVEKQWNGEVITNLAQRFYSFGNKYHIAGRRFLFAKQQFHNRTSASGILDFAQLGHCRRTFLGIVQLLDISFHV